MKLRDVSVSAVGLSPWLIPNPLLQTPAGLGLAVTFSADANLTVDVDYTYDDPAQTPQPVTLARAGANLTVTLAAHGLNANDSVTISNPTGDPNNTWAGDYVVASITDDNNFVVTVPNAGAAGAAGAVRTFRLFKHPTLQGMTGAPPARADGGFSWQIGAVRLRCTAYTAGVATLSAQQGVGR